MLQQTSTNASGKRENLQTRSRAQSSPQTLEVEPVYFVIGFNKVRSHPLIRSGASERGEGGFRLILYNIFYLLITKTINYSYAYNLLPK